MQCASRHCRSHASARPALSSSSSGGSRLLAPPPRPRAVHSSALRQQRRQQQRQRSPPARGATLLRRAGPIDAAPAWTLDQIAGLAFGAVMLAFYFGSQQVDVVIARQQRRQLGLCEACGGLNEPGSCSQAGCPLRRSG